MNDQSIFNPLAAPPGLRPAAVLINDAPGYTVKEISLIFAYSNRESVFHRKTVSLATGQSYNYRSPEWGFCSGVFCVAWVEVDNGTHRLLSGRTPYAEGGMWDVTTFRPGLNMVEQP